MQVVILAGGRGSRIAEETTIRPKPMVEIGGKPILCHIMEIYASYGLQDFLIACGYKGHMIKEYFYSFFICHSDYFVNLGDGSRQVVNGNSVNWRVGVVDTGIETMTAGRMLRLRNWIGHQTFLLTYGDGVADVNISRLIAFHRSHGRLATVTAVRPPSRFGGLSLDGDAVVAFSEKPQTGEGWINGGYFVFEPEVLDYISGDSSILERDVLERLAADDQLRAFRHEGFWQPMDTLRDKELLESLCAGGNAPWRRRAAYVVG